MILSGKRIQEIIKSSEASDYGLSERLTAENKILLPEIPG
jgi:hypothetical protein